MPEDRCTLRKKSRFVLLCPLRHQETRFNAVVMCSITDNFPIQNSHFCQHWFALSYFCFNLHLCRLRSHLMKELEINDTPYGLRVMATDHPTNKSVGLCPKDITTAKLNEKVALQESIWIGSSPDWTTLQIHLGKIKCHLLHD